MSYTLYMASQSGVTKSNWEGLPDEMRHSDVTSPFTHTGLTNEKTYYLVLTATNANGKSTESAEVLVTPIRASLVPLAAGGDHTCALLSNGTFNCWGRNLSGELGNGTTTNSTAPVTVSDIP